MIEESVKFSTELIKANRCSDYDDECKFVEDHAACFAGGIHFAKCGNFYETPVADGYCPFLVGEERA